jgi:hypothetical protein
VPTFIDSSNGGNGLAAISCMGCHGRTEDMGNDSTSVGLGAGLRQHHQNTGTTSCVGCHTDSNPANYTPVGENVLPPYYADPGIGHPNIPADPCDPVKEDFEGSPTGIDNDGNDLYEAGDPACAVNSVPVADAGPDQTVFVTDTVQLDGSGSSDVDLDALTFAWSLTTVPTGSSATLSDPAAVSPTFDVDLPGTYVAQLIVNDGTEDSAPDTVTITTDNSAPTADPNGPYFQTTGLPVHFDGSGSSDVDGTIDFYAWNFGDGIITGTGVNPTHIYGMVLTLSP